MHRPSEKDRAVPKDWPAVQNFAMEGSNHVQPYYADHQNSCKRHREVPVGRHPNFLQPLEHRHVPVLDLSKNPRALPELDDLASHDGSESALWQKRPAPQRDSIHHIHDDVERDDRLPPPIFFHLASLPAFVPLQFSVPVAEGGPHPLPKKLDIGVILSWKKFPVYGPAQGLYHFLPDRHHRFSATYCEYPLNDPLRKFPLPAPHVFQNIRP